MLFVKHILKYDVEKFITLSSIDYEFINYTAPIRWIDSSGDMFRFETEMGADE